ncbi:mycofactocin biosynthesis chaperone MftB [Streptomyces varsoviensis]|uniref:mycofactocin biosynthesis chaperone MftB n=1 Tax=Streptomyces varsoviensis TaxID=67373 RepID=UPI0004C662F0|nr:mycofactocin biosynthesis chaperone MftB [Streptomyces varsoviensis]
MSTDAAAADAGTGGGRPFDLDGAWRLHEQVAVRPERFGALLYHYGNRRLSFLRSPVLLTVVRSLADRPTARQACAQAGVRTEELASYRAALAALAESRMICERREP